MASDTHALTQRPFWWDRLTSSQLAILQEDDESKLVEVFRKNAGILLNAIENIVLAYCRLNEIGKWPEDFRLSIPFVPQMACGQVLPEVVASFAGRSKLLKMVACLPISDQARFANNEAISLVDADGQVRSWPAWDLTDADARQVIGSGQVRSETDQMQYLVSEQRKRFSPDIQQIPYEIRGRKFIVTQPTEFTFKQVRMIYESMLNSRQG